MFRDYVAKVILFPFSVLYGIGVSIRDFLYRMQLLRGFKFDIPIISVGNLSVGGAGKTPHIEYLIRLLQPYVDVAVLSRGYKRKTKGYREVRAQDTAEMVGDEPLQFKRKYRDLDVVVAENRAFAIPQIISYHPNVQTILLDDAFQHRSVRPGLNILLTQYDLPFTDDYLLPMGRLREWRSSYKRADIMVVSKCPPELDEQERQELLSKLKPHTYQRVYFSYYSYGRPYYIFNSKYRFDLSQEVDIILISAIAGTDYLVSYLEDRVGRIVNLDYEDHHFFTEFDLSRLKDYFDKMDSKNKVIITTEKDAVRLQLHREKLDQEKLPIFALPIQVKFHFNETEKFNSDVQEFLLNFKI